MLMPCSDQASLPRHPSDCGLSSPPWQSGADTAVFASGWLYSDMSSNHSETGGASSSWRQGLAPFHVPSDLQLAALPTAVSCSTSWLFVFQVLSSFLDGSPPVARCSLCVLSRQPCSSACPYLSFLTAPGPGFRVPLRP